MNDGLERYRNTKEPDSSGIRRASIAPSEPLSIRLREIYTHRTRSAVNPNINAVHRLYAPLQIGDQTYRVKLTVKDYKHPPEKGRGFYTHELTEIALPDVKRVVAHSEEPMPTPPPGNTITVHDLLTGASRNDGTKLTPPAQA